KSFHPDERNILGQTPAIQASTGYKVTFFAYGQLPVYLYRATGELISTPALFQQAFHNENLALGAYWLFLIVILAGLLTLFLESRFALSHYTLASFVFSNFFLWYFAPVFPGQGISILNLIFWAALLGFLYFLFGFLREEDDPVLEKAVAGVIFISFLVVKFFPIFTIWMKALDDGPAKMLNFFLVAVVALALSWITSKFFEMEWLGMPIYGAAGALFLLGILPFFLPVAFAQVFGVLAFTMLVAGILFAWTLFSTWGRFALALFAFWTLLAALNHSGIQYTGYGECMIIGRVWSAFFSTTTIVAVYFLVKRLYQNVGMALLASAFVAFAVVSIEQAHYCITESFITMMFVLMVLCSWEILQKGDWNSYLLAGGAFGLSMSAKTSSLYYVFIIATAHLVLLSRKTAKDWEREDRKLGESQGIYSAFAGVFLALVLVVFMGVGWKFRGVIGDLFHYDPRTGFALGLVLFAVLT
ncbi:MAG TPA: phospholipid carrier-dependent glycosyltransferase, partial [bacterium]|nr:phospholipid carrier-dependent glycosyltransferase [bacterium]